MPSDRYAVFGDPIGHSQSPQIHQFFAAQTQQDIIYEAQAVPAEQFNQAVSDFFTRGGKGLNCTVPLKELAWQRADLLSQRARLSKAVNTLAIQADGRLLGDNTDGAGLLTDLLVNQQIPLSNQRILILGAGGAARGIIEPILTQSPSRLVIANRTETKAIHLCQDFSQLGSIQACSYRAIRTLQFDLIINATSASLTGQLPPLADTLLATDGCCYDLAYADQPTAFVRWGRERGASKSLDGLGMLIEQAAEAFFIWRGVHPDTATLIKQLQNKRQPYE